MTPEFRIKWEPEEVVPGLLRLPVPYTHGPSVNTFLVPGPDGVLLVDAGYPSRESSAAFDAQFASLGLRRADIRLVLVTHADVDHIGLLDRVRADSGARVLAHPAERDRGPLWRGSLEWLTANGYPGPAPEHRWDPPELPADTEAVEDGTVVEWAGFELRLLHCPGHTPGLLCAYEPRRRLLLSTDHVLRASTPIGLFGPVGNPFGDYLESLESLRGLDVDLVVPGHGRPFRGLDGRIDAIRREVEAQLERLEATLRPGPANAWELAHSLHPNADTRARVMQTFLVLAALRHLERLGRVTAEPGPVVSYRAA